MCCIKKRNNFLIAKSFKSGICFSSIGITGCQSSHKMSEWLKSSRINSEAIYKNSNALCNLLWIREENLDNTES